MALIRLDSMRSVPVQRSNLRSYSGDLFQEFDNYFNHFQHKNGDQSQLVQGYPVDLYETGDSIVLQMAVPGICKDNLDISIEKRQLTISGDFPNTTENEDRRYWLQSIPQGHLNRNLVLPVDVEVDAIEATIQEGLLTLTMPKVTEAKARQITVSAA